MNNEEMIGEAAIEMMRARAEDAQRTIKIELLLSPEELEQLALFLQKMRSAKNA